MKTLVVDTPEGQIHIRLCDKEAPQTCALVEKLVKGGHYAGCGFYRAEKKFCVQGGLRQVTGATKPNPFGTVPLEYSLKNQRGHVSMARWDDPSSGDGEWFINLSDNTNLDRSSNQGWGLGFCAWGIVTKGLDIAERISTLPTHSDGGMTMLNQAVEFVQMKIVEDGA